MIMKIAEAVHHLEALAGSGFRGRVECHFPGNGTIASVHVHQVFDSRPVTETKAADRQKLEKAPMSG